MFYKIEGLDPNISANANEDDGDDEDNEDNEDDEADEDNEGNVAVEETVAVEKTVAVEANKGKTNTSKGKAKSKKSKKKKVTSKIAKKLKKTKNKATKVASTAVNVTKDIPKVASTAVNVTGSTIGSTIKGPTIFGAQTENEKILSTLSDVVMKLDLITSLQNANTVPYISYNKLPVEYAQKYNPSDPMDPSKWYGPTPNIPVCANTNKCATCPIIEEQNYMLISEYYTKS